MSGWVGSLHHPLRRQRLSLPQHGLNRFSLQINRIAYFRRMRRTITRIIARADSLTVQSIATLVSVLKLLSYLFIS